MSYKRIAFYGKGGIGKSTIAANLSAILSKKGKKVLHIGCDPKADSTRLLMKRRIPTVLNLLRDKGDDLKKEDILFEGVYGVSCLEAGGPEPGLGCAGMGISSVIELLTRLGIFEMDWDLIVYDVLGDVVCGGFSIPMRKNYVDEVYIVTSSEFMSLYAANNILKGIKNFATLENKIFAGIIHNKWTLDRDKRIIDHYIKESQGYLVTSIQEEDLVKRADYQKSSIFELDKNSPMAKNMGKLGEYVLNHHRTFHAQPLDDEELEKIFEFIFSQEQI